MANLKRGNVPIKRGGTRKKRSSSVPLGLTITTEVLGAMEELVPIAAPGLPIVSINGGFQIHTWQLLGSPPAWISISGAGATARILGTPPAGSAGDISLSVKVTTTDGQTFTKTVTGTIAIATPDLGISTSALGAMTVGTPITAPGFAVVAINGVLPMTWAKVSGPSWMNVGSSTTRTVRVTGTPALPVGAVTLRVRVTDSLGESFEKDITGTVSAAPAALAISTSTLGDMTEDTVIASPGFPIVALNGTGPYVWSFVGTSPSWMSIGGTSATGRINGTPPEGSAGSVSVTVKVVDSLGAFDTQVVTGIIVDDDADTTFDGYFNRRMGFTKNISTPAQIMETLDLIAAGTGGNRIVGGLVRWDFGGPQWGGAGLGSIDPADISLLNQLNARGVKGHAILGYTDRHDQRRLHFPGSINASKQVIWTGGIGAGINEQMGTLPITVNGHSYPALVANAGNNWYSPAGASYHLNGTGVYGNGLTIHGPGIPYLSNYPCSIASGSNLLTIALPTGDNPGAQCADSSWIGQGVSLSGVPAGTTVTDVVAGGLRLSANATATGSRTCIIGAPASPVPRPFLSKSQVPGNLGIILETPAKLTAGVSGTYYIGGTNAGLDQKIWYDDPRDFQTVCHDIIKATNPDGGPHRVKRGELWNEMPWGMGSRPKANIPRAGRLLAHGYVGVKLADPTVIVCLPGPGFVKDSNANWLNAPDWYEALMEFWHNTDPNYFTDLLSANGLTKARAPKVPGDEAGHHPYGNNTKAPTHEGMNQLARIFNTIGAATGGDYLPVAPTEQGINWTRTGEPGTLAPGPAYTDMRDCWEIWHGIQRWYANTHLNGPGANCHLPDGDGSAGTITVANRMSKMKKVVSCPTEFALREPPDASGKYGIRWGSDGLLKTVTGNDPFDVFCDL